MISERYRQGHKLTLKNYEIKFNIMTIIEKVLNANGVLTTTEGVFGNTVIIAWDELGINEEARFTIDTDLSIVYQFLGY